MKLHQVEGYLESQVELVSTLEEGAIFNLLAVLMVKSEAPKGALVVDVEEIFLVDSKEKASASASAVGLVYPFSRYA